MLNGFMKSSQFQHTTDQQLLENFYGDKNQEWIGILLERYTMLLLGVCMKYLKNEAEAKDAVQQVFLKVLTEVPKYKIDYFKSWLYMVAKNHCLMRLRDKGQVTKDISQVQVADEPKDVQEILEDEKTYDLLAESLGELNPEQQQCVRLFYLEKLSYLQVSEKTGFSMMQVKSFIQNGKRNLKILMEKKLNLPGRQS